MQDIQAISIGNKHWGSNHKIETFLMQLKPCLGMSVCVECLKFLGGAVRILLLQKSRADIPDNLSIVCVQTNWPG